MDTIMHKGKIIHRPTGPPLTHIVEFAGKPITVIEWGGYYVAMKPICRNMGLKWNAQYEMIQRNPVLNSTVRMIRTIGEDDKKREMLCLPLEYLNGWLFKIDVARYKGDMRESLIGYQKECYKALYEHFFGTDAKPAPSEPGPGMMLIPKHEMINLQDQMINLQDQMIGLQKQLSDALTRVGNLQADKIRKLESQPRTGRLTMGEKAKIRAMAGSGQGPAEIAKRIRRKPSTVSSFLRREKG